MSRRKQEKPQPRKNLVQGEVAELTQDFLTCGVCRRDFPLCEIVRFIQHKVHACNKENSCINKLFGVIPEDSDSEDGYAALPHGKPPPLEEISFGNDVLNEVSSSSSLKNAVAKDAAAREYAEPCNYICSTCKQPHASAWALLYHVQNHHGLRIYMDSTPSQNVNHNVEQSGIKPPLEHYEPSPSALRAPLLERQLDSRHIAPLYPRSSSQDLRVDLLPLPTANVRPPVQSSPPPLIEVHHLDSSPPSSSVGDGAEPQLDFYSQRLRELAGATSPNALVSSGKLLQPSFKAVVKNEPNTNEQSQQSTASMPSQLPQSSASSTTSENPVSPKQNPRACDFCGKSFRFMSNLIVHRRSHTGEKPFKCHICNHACTQASKLKRHMKTHKRRKKTDKLISVDSCVKKNGVPSCDKVENKNNHDGQTNGENEYASDDQVSGKVNNTHEGDAEEEEEIDVEEEDLEDDDDTDNFKKLTVDLGPEEMVAEDLSKKAMKNGTAENNGICNEGEKKGKEKEKNTTKHSLLSEVMEKIGLASIQQYSEAYKQALKESSILKQERHSDGSASNDGANCLERPAREGTRSAGQSPLSFNTGLLSAFDQSMGMKRIKLEDHYRDKEDNSLYAGLWIPSVSSHSMSSYKDLYSADGSDRRKSKTESALNCMALSCMRSSSPRPGPSTTTSMCNIGTVNNSLLKPKDQRRNDTCEFCGKVFKNCSNLTVHRRSHTGEKPYKCELCSYACAQSSKLTRHMKTHGRTGKDVYRCRFCDMPFSVPSTLEKHMRKCVVSQSGGSSYLLAERESDSKEMTS